VYTRLTLERLEFGCRSVHVYLADSAMCYYGVVASVGEPGEISDRWRLRHDADAGFWIRSCSKAR